MAWTAIALALTYHWSVRNGSITTLERSPCGTMCVCGSILSISRPLPAARMTNLARLERHDAMQRASSASRIG
jgi:hypothetical protein